MVEEREAARVVARPALGAQVARRLAARTEADDGDIWRVVRGALRGRARPVPGVLPWDECAADVWPKLWRAYGDRWRVGVA